MIRALPFLASLLLGAGCAAEGLSYRSKTVPLEPEVHGPQRVGRHAISMSWSAKDPIHLARSDGQRGPSIAGLALTLRQDNETGKDGSTATVGYVFLNGSTARGDGLLKLTFVGYDRTDRPLEHPILTVDVPSWKCWYDAGPGGVPMPAVEEKDKPVARDLLKQVDRVEAVFSEMGQLTACRGPGASRADEAATVRDGR